MKSAFKFRSIVLLLFIFGLFSCQKTENEENSPLSKTLLNESKTPQFWIEDHSVECSSLQTIITTLSFTMSSWATSHIPADEWVMYWRKDDLTRSWTKTVGVAPATSYPLTFNIRNNSPLGLLMQGDGIGRIECIDFVLVWDHDGTAPPTTSGTDYYYNFEGDYYYNSGHRFKTDICIECVVAN